MIKTLTKVVDRGSIAVFRMNSFLFTSRLCSECSKLGIYRVTFAFTSHASFLKNDKFPSKIRTVH